MNGFRWGGKVVKDAMWEEEFPGVGMMYHAFPQVSFKEPSFKRNLDDRNFLTGVTDGDQVMWFGVLGGMGGGLALRNRSGVLQANDACSFHKGKSIKKMFTGFLRDGQAEIFPLLQASLTWGDKLRDRHVT